MHMQQCFRCKERYFLRDQTIAVALITFLQPHQRKSRGSLLLRILCTCVHLSYRHFKCMVFPPVFVAPKTGEGLKQATSTVLSMRRVDKQLWARNHNLPSFLRVR